MKFLTNLKTGPILLLSVLILACSSCFEIFETIHFNKNGSGHASIKTDFSGMKSLMDMTKGIADDSTKKESESFSVTMNKSISGQTEELNTIQGISNVRSEADTVNYTYTLSYDFANIDALNKAMNLKSGPGSISEAMGVFSGNENKTNESFEYFTLKKGVLTRNFKNMSSDGGNEEDNASMEMAMSMMKDAKLHFNYSFDGDIKKLTTKYQAWDKNGAQLSGEVSFDDLLKKSKELGFSVKIKN